MTILHNYWQPLAALYQSHADTTIASGSKAYVRNQFDFFGIKAPIRRQLQSAFFLQYSLPPIDNLDDIILSAWHYPQRELQYSAMEALFKLKQKSVSERIHLFEEMIITKSWWDTVDYIAPNLIGYHFTKFPDQQEIFIEKWMASDNIWLQRSCLLFQLRAKDKTDETLLYNLIIDLADHKEFFIRKAIGWALREYAKVNPNGVFQFVTQNPLSNLSKKEALKHFN